MQTTVRNLKTYLTDRGITVCDDGSEVHKARKASLLDTYNRVNTSLPSTGSTPYSFKIGQHYIDVVDINIVRSMEVDNPYTTFDKVGRASLSVEGNVWVFQTNKGCLMVKKNQDTVIDYYCTDRLGGYDRKGNKQPMMLTEG